MARGEIEEAMKWFKQAEQVSYERNAEAYINSLNKQGRVLTRQEKWPEALERFEAAIEKARQDKLIGNALEAAVVLHSNSEVTARLTKEELEEFFILSDLTVHQAEEAHASVRKTGYKKCGRCWRHRPYVGTSEAHPELCDRCEAVVIGLQKTEGRAPAGP